MSFFVPSSVFLNLSQCRFFCPVCLFTLSRFRCFCPGAFFFVPLPVVLTSQNPGSDHEWDPDAENFVGAPEVEVQDVPVAVPPWDQANRRATESFQEVGGEIHPRFSVASSR